MSTYTTREYTKTVPLDHHNPKGEQIELFSRMVFRPQNKKAPIFVYLQGGPGYSSPRQVESHDWMKVILENYRLLLLDQRGTGRSQKIGPELWEDGVNGSDMARYFSFYRADSIVRDLEYLRKKIFRVKKWFLLCQSYGGFVATTYLSFFPHSLAGAILFGGLPPLTAPSVLATYQKIIQNICRRNKEFYKAYPKDIDKVRRIVDILIDNPLPLGIRGKLTAQRFLDIGLMLGRTRGTEALHLFLEDPFLDSSKNRISWAFATRVERQLSFETNPIYAVLHESIYCDQRPSQWSAHKILSTSPEFSLDQKKIFFHGETIRKEMFLEYGKLKGFRKCANLLAQKKDWGPLYDREQLEKNEVPLEALVYKTDYYVDYDYSLEAQKAIQHCRVWAHDSWQHDSLRTHGKSAVKKLLKRLEKRL